MQPTISHHTAPRGALRLAVTSSFWTGAILRAALGLVIIAGCGQGMALRAQPATVSLQPGAQDREQAIFPICSGPRRITCVVDGDTIWYRGAKIRIADIDTPETNRPRCPREGELGRKATRRLQKLLSEAPFRLEPAPSGREHDRFGRELKVVKRGDGSIGTVLVREGLAQRWGSARRSWC